jgi:hypothetical protein
VRKGERFRASVTPGRDLTLVMRTDAWYPSRLDVQVDGACRHVDHRIVGWSRIETPSPSGRVTRNARPSFITRIEPGETETRRDYALPLLAVSMKGRARGQPVRGLAKHQQRSLLQRHCRSTKKSRTSTA